MALCISRSGGTGLYRTTVFYTQESPRSTIVIYVKETIIQEDQFVPHFSLIYNFPML